MSNANVVLYGSGLLNSGNPATDQAQMQAVQSSGFSTVILWTLHVNANGDFYYNGTLVVSNGAVTGPFASTLPGLIQQMRTGGSVSAVLFGIGSADVSDFANIQSLLSTPAGTALLKSNFAAMVQALDIDGFDFDLEEYPLSSFTDTVVQLAQLLYAGYGKFVAFCPYYDPQWWLGCAQQIYQQSGTAGVVRWWNLQCYAGGGGNSPSDWVSLIAANASSIGVTDPNAYIVPGYWCANRPGCDSGQCPASIQSTFSGLSGTVQGGFIWNSGDIFSCESSDGCGGGGMAPGDYAQAIINGLSGTTVQVSKIVGAEEPAGAAG